MKKKKNSTNPAGRSTPVSQPPLPSCPDFGPRMSPGHRWVDSVSPGQRGRKPEPGSPADEVGPGGIAHGNRCTAGRLGGGCLGLGGSGKGEAPPAVSRGRGSFRSSSKAPTRPPLRSGPFAGKALQLRVKGSPFQGPFHHLLRSRCLTRV